MGDEGRLHGNGYHGIPVDVPPPQHEQRRAQHENAEADEARVPGVPGRADDQVVRVGIPIRASGSAGGEIARADAEDRM